MEAGEWLFCFRRKPMDIREANIFCTGGAGTLGHAIARRRQKDGWKGRFTVYSRHTHILEQMKREFPDVAIVQGDIRDTLTLYHAMVGHDCVIHAGAVKVIPVSEFQSIDTIQVNVMGSLNVCDAAVRAGVKDVLGISTDKACHAANAYGATKYLMEKIFQEFARAGTETKFHLVRYGNVLESNGSVVEAWKAAVARKEPIKITNPNMTRFWISPAQAVDYVIDAFRYDSGCIYIPKMSALPIGKLAKYTLGEENYTSAIIPLRPGEKIHECLLTSEESWFALSEGKFFLLYPTTHKKFGASKQPYTSDVAPELTREELEELLKNA